MDFRQALESALGNAYVIERELGGGGMSRVFVAEDRSLGRKVVVKVLPPEFAAGVSIERFQREIRVIAKLHHPHIVPLFTAGEVSGIPYFTMPLVEGESLRARLAHGELPIGDVVSIFRDVAKALAYAHGHGVVHRDIKPDNVLLTAHAASVLDFGVAKAIRESTLSDLPTLTERGVALGTPAYMAPEQAAADQQVDHRADIYALGAMAYEMLVGRTPFAGRSAQQLIAAHITEVPTSVDRERQAIPPALTALVMQCLAKRPADRPQSAEDILNALDAIATPRAGTQVAGARRSPAQRWWWAGVAVVVLAIVATRAAIVSRRAPVSALNHNRVVVAPFINLTGDAELDVLGPLIADGVTRGLEQLDSITVVSSQTVLVDSSGKVRRLGDLGALPLVGVETRAGRVVGGSYSRQGDTLRLQARIVNASDGRVDLALDPIVGSVDAPDRAIEQLRGSVATALQASQTKAIIGSIGHVPALAAYRAFLRAWEEDVEAVAAQPDLIEASRLDSTFTLAQYWLAENYSGWGNRKLADSVLRILSERRGSFSPVELELFEEGDAYMHHAWERDLRATRQLLKRDSTHANVGGVALAAFNTNRFREMVGTIEQFRPVQGARSWFDWNKIAVGDHALGDFKAELTAATNGRARPISPFGHIVLLEKEMRALAALGELSSLQQKIDSTVAAWGRGTASVRIPTSAVDVSVSTNPAQAYERLAVELYAHGHRDEAAAYVRKALDWHAKNATIVDALAPDSLQVSRARLLMLAGSLDSARTIWAALAPRDTLYTGARVQLAVVGALQRDTVAALRTMHTLDSLAHLEYAFGAPRVDEARIAAALGHKDEAVAFFRLAIREGVGFNPGWHSDANFQSLQDYAPFKALLRPVD